MNNIYLDDLSLIELQELMINIDEKKFRGNQIFLDLHKKGITKINDIKQIPLDSRNKLIDHYKICEIEIIRRFDSKLDTTKKYLFKLEDGNIIESVFMKYKYGNTVCVSSQVGCRMGCTFCASTKEGLARNLRPSEMLRQVYSIEKDLNERVDNIVLMGSGEPLDNYENVIKFMTILHEENGKNMSYRNMTLSTCGVAHRIYDLANLNLPITLSISLHEANNEKRCSIMPITRRFSIDNLIEAINYYVNTTKRRMTFEYVLIDGGNDTEEDAKSLSKLARNIKCHINLIPLNPIKEYDKHASSEKNIIKFRNHLEDAGIPTTIRRELGRDINAACGQLRIDYMKNSKEVNN